MALDLARATVFSQRLFMGIENKQAQQAMLFQQSHLDFLHHPATTAIIVDKDASRSSVGLFLTRFLSTVTVAFRKTIRRVSSSRRSSAPYGTSGTPHHTMNHDVESGPANEADERRALLPRGGTSSTRSSDTQVEEHGFWYRLLVDTDNTPGFESRNLLVRWSAKTWNAAKITLYHCRLHATPWVIMNTRSNLAFSTT